MSSRFSRPKHQILILLNFLLGVGVCSNYRIILTTKQKQGSLHVFDFSQTRNIHQIVIVRREPKLLEGKPLVKISTCFDLLEALFQVYLMSGLQRLQSFIVKFIFLPDIGGKAPIVQSPNRGFESGAIYFKTEWVTDSHGRFNQGIRTFFGQVEGQDVCA